MTARPVAVVGIVGWKNSGKTTLVERLVAALVAAGYRVATVKHADHSFDVDRPGADSFRHRAAGATEVAVVSRRRWALMHELDAEPEPSLADILARLSPVDIFVVEGYKRAAIPKIEVRRRDAGPPLAPTDPNVIAIAADLPISGATVPVFGLDDIAAIAAFVERTVMKR